MIVMPEPYVNGWRAGCTCAAKQQSVAGKENPYDGRTKEGRQWSAGFHNALDAYQGNYGCFIFEYVKQAAEGRKEAAALEQTLQRVRG